MDGVEFDVNVRRSAGVPDIRRGEIRIVYNCFKKYFFRFITISVYSFQSCQSKYYNCDGLNVVCELYNGLDI